MWLCCNECVNEATHHRDANSSKYIFNQLRIFSINRNNINFSDNDGTKSKLADEMCGVKLENAQCVKDLGVKVVPNLKFSQQFILMRTESSILRIHM